MRRPTLSRDRMMDALLVAGVGLIGAGLWLVYPPAALVITGILFVAGALLIGRP